MPLRPAIGEVATPAAPSAPAATVVRPARISELTLLVVVVAVHVGLAMVMRTLPAVATLHAIACVGVGVIAAVRRRVEEVTFVVAYIVGAEVLWRMTYATVFWEYGKYAMSAVLFVALLRLRTPRNRGLALGYFALHLPSVLLTLLKLDLAVARQELSFNLSGPLALTLSVLFFSNIRLTARDLRLTMIALIGPVVGIGALAYYSTATAVNLEFFGDSNVVTSGGFGPNQVSAMLGLGLLFALLMVLDRRTSLRLRVPLVILAVGFAAQAALTFSRGGLTLAFAGAAAAIFYLVRDARTRLTLLIFGALLFSVGKYVVVPKLEVFTAGKFGERYTSVDPSGRGIIAGFDLQIFSENPILGVGPGVAPGIREELGRASAAHTEFTRLLAEHGVLGILVIVFLILLAARTIRGAHTLLARAVVVALVVWTALFLLVNAMRLAAPSFVFGLACSVAYASQPVRRRPPLLAAPQPRT